MATDYGRCLAARATHPNGRSLLRVSALCVGIAIAPLLMSCTEAERQQVRADNQRSEQQNMDDLYRVCVDGVEYLSQNNFGGHTIVPHLKPDGKPYTCEARS